MSTANPASRREKLAWVLFLVAVAGAGYLAYENFMLRRSLEAQIANQVLNQLKGNFTTAMNVVGVGTKEDAEPKITPGTIMRIDTLFDQGERVKFEDTSIWELVGPFSNFSNLQWKKDQSITIIEKQNYIGGGKYMLLNGEAGNSCMARPLYVPPPDKKPAALPAEKK